LSLRLGKYLFGFRFILCRSCRNRQRIGISIKIVMTLEKID
jgi:hypothetical protein